MSLPPDPNTSLQEIPSKDTINRAGRQSSVSATESREPTGPVPAKATSDITLTDLQQHMDEIASSNEHQPAHVLHGPLGDAKFYSFYLSLLAESKIRLTDDIEEPTVCLEIFSQHQVDTFGTLGNFSLIVGKAKSRKTYLLSAVVAALIKGDTVMGKIRGCLPANKRSILYFDTEQHKGHVKRVLRRIADLSGDNELNDVHVYRLKKYGPVDRLNAIRVAIEQTDSLGAVIIDGIRDTVFDINDAKEATDRATDLQQWTEDKDAHLITIIHENKGNSNARGHLGTELVNKAETVVSVSRDQNDSSVSIVTPENCRNREFEPFGFSIGEDGLPYINGDTTGKGTSTARTRKTTAGSLKRTDVEQIVCRAFANDTQLRYSQLRTNIMEASEHTGCTLGKSKAEELIQRLQTDGLLTKFKPIKEKYDSYSINTEKLSIQSS